MTPEVAALAGGLAGGLIALAGAFGVQWVAGRQARRRRTIELAGQFLAVQKSIGYVADLTHVSTDSSDGQLRAIEAQDRSIALGYELVLLTKHPLRTHVQSSLNATLGVLRAAGTEVPAAHWRGMRDAHDGLTTDLDNCLQNELGKTRIS